MFIHCFLMLSFNVCLLDIVTNGAFRAMVPSVIRTHSENVIVNLMLFNMIL